MSCLNRAIDNKYKLSPEQLKFYEENGFLVFKKLFDTNTLEKFKKRYKEICDGKVTKNMVSIYKDFSLDHKPNAEDKIYKVQELLFDEVFSTYSENPDVLHIVSQFVGDDITAVNLMLICKPPGAGRHPSHQDLYYFPFRPTDKILAVWTAIDPATVDNGCLYVVPGSHKAKTLHNHEKHQASMRFYHVIKDEDILAPEQKRKYLEMEPGDTVFFHPLLIHGSGPNISNKPRKALTVHFKNSGCYFIDVAGTAHENLIKEYDEVMRKKKMDIKYTDSWLVKSKEVRRKTESKL